jgi:hypothetical protein
MNSLLISAESAPKAINTIAWHIKFIANHSPEVVKMKSNRDYGTLPRKHFFALN